MASVTVGYIVQLALACLVELQRVVVSNELGNLASLCVRVSRRQMDCKHKQASKQASWLQLQLP
jgi:hypothetical protein